MLNVKYQMAKFTSVVNRKQLAKRVQYRTWTVSHHHHDHSDLNSSIRPRVCHHTAILLFVMDRARQLYKNISMVFLFPVKDSKLCTGVNATFNASCYG